MSGLSIITGQGLPADSSGACGGRTIKQSASANIFIIDESCLANGFAVSAPDDDRDSVART